MPKSAKTFTVILAVLFIMTLGTTANRAQPAHKWVGALRKSLSIKPRFGDRVQHLVKNPVRVQAVAGNGAVTALPLMTETDRDLQPEPLKVKGIYLTSWMTGSSKFLNQIVDFIAKTEINAVVIDVKDDTGVISYPSSVPLAKSIGSALRKFDPVKVLNLMEKNNIYPIARIVVFKDPFLAKKRTDLAVQSSKGGLWQDKLGLYWVDPYNKAVWEYNVAIAKEAASLGFKEVQFDYVRFTSDGPTQYCRYPGVDNRLKADVIRDFLQYAYQELNPLGVKVSADVFGFVCTAQDDLSIGQFLEKLAPHVDILCPMVYPSHYPNGSYGIADPDNEPYKTIFHGLTVAKKRLEAMNPEPKVILRPWLQDFSLRHVYKRDQLLAQIKAVNDAGFQEFIFWNPSNKYDLKKYRTKEEAAVAPTPVPSATPEPTETPQNTNLQQSSLLPSPSSGEDGKL